MDLLFLGVSLIILFSTSLILISLFIIDLRVYLLPNRYVFPFGALGIIFHSLTHFSLLSPGSMVLGAIIGGGLLWVVRFFGTKYYKQEAMGLGDVKLMTAAGLWLGPEHIITAIMVGATAGLIHGLGVAGGRALKTGDFSIQRLIIPAGPGFIIGIILTFIYVFGPDYGVQISKLIEQTGGTSWGL